MVVVDVGILWLFLASSLVVLMQAQALRLARTNRELAASEAALRMRNAELDGVNARLSEMDAMKSSVLAGISQELRTPVQAILSEAELIQRHHSHNAELVQQLVSAIIADGAHLVQILEALPERGDQGIRTLELNESRVDPASVLREAVNTVAGVAKCGDVTIDLEDGGRVSQVWANHERLTHALVVLLDAAVTSAPRGSTVTTSVAAHGPEVVFSILQPEADAALSRRISEIVPAAANGQPAVSDDLASGFPMKLCREIVENHRGRLWVDDQRGHGIGLYVAVPAIEYEPRPAIYDAKSPSGSPSGSGVH